MGVSMNVDTCTPTLLSRVVFVTDLEQETKVHSEEETVCL